MTSHDDLNPSQARAALHKQGPLLIIAGAGAGKTHTIAHRVAHLARSGVPAENILAITFTNKAAGELRERIGSLLASQGLRGIPTAATFHSLGAQILRREHERFQIPRLFGITDRGESLSFVKRAIEARDLDLKTIEPKRILSAISKNKNRLIDSAVFIAEAASYQDELVGAIWQKYTELMKKAGLLDFDDLIVWPVRLLTEHADIRDKYRERFRFIHIDEYQDTSASQDRFAELLVGPELNICAIGDGDQSIYGWRDANPENILKFPEKYPGTTIVMLEENYRSTKYILDAANNVIKKNRNRHEKNLYTRKVGGEKIALYEAFGETDEANFVAETAVELRDKGVRPDTIAVLFRANFQSRILEEAFLRSGIPYELVGTRFYERKEVKDSLAYLRYAMNPADSESFRRIMGAPRRGIGAASAEKILRGDDAVPRRAREARAAIERLAATIRDLAATIEPSRLLTRIITESGLEKMYRDEPDGDERTENMRELVSLASRYDRLPKPTGLEELLTDTALLSDQDTIGDHSGGVRLMTVHAAKGLEFDTVFVTGLEQDLFPHRARDDEKDGTNEMRKEEERRLFYVALTRAKRKLFLTYALYRTIFGQRTLNIPSVFLQDIKPESIDFSSGLGGSRPTSDEDVIVWDCLK